MKLDAHTYGGSKAAEYLVDTLNEAQNKRYINKVSKMLHKYFTLLKSAEDIKDEKSKITFVHWVCEKGFDSIGNLNVPIRIKTLAKNVLSTKHKNVLRLLKTTNQKSKKFGNYERIGLDDEDFKYLTNRTKNDNLIDYGR